jgi:Protein of unknown function (DUF3224)
MTTHATGRFEMKSWNENPYQELEGGRKLTRASVSNAFSGEIEGESTLEYLMAYSDEDTAYFVGMERIDGRIGDRTGSFVLQQTGTYKDGTVNASWFVVPRSGTGELAGLTGEGGFVWVGHDQKSTEYALDYDINEVS